MAIVSRDQASDARSLSRRLRLSDPNPSASPHGSELGIDASRLVKFLAWTTAGLLLLHSAFQCVHYLWYELPWWIKDRFDIDVENSVPTWFSGLLLFFAAALLLHISLQKRRDADSWLVYWWGLTVGFMVLSLDEIAGFHESMNAMTDSPWTLYGAIGAGVVGLVYLRFLNHLPRAVAIQMILAGGLYLGGALGVERASDWYSDNDAMDTLAYNLVNVLEEGGEMFGVVLFIGSLLNLTQTERLSWRLHRGEE